MLCEQIAARPDMVTTTLASFFRDRGLQIHHISLPTSHQTLGEDVEND